MGVEDCADLDQIYEALLAMEARMHHEHVEHLRIALDSARTIGVAIGIVMCQEGLDRDEAFQLVVRASRNSNRKLRDVAAGIERVGRLAF